ncbi:MULTISPECIES: S8 family peptidase [Pseudoalteromonas]|uniref:S8 family serine peptidase n=1 Tax=Pseudoalteromonas obscura TaxID=3048491 RepID=A0ABT7EH04_9GAMM|nr:MULTISPECIES: S8 family serine peptidase [Pseudoalteromonas]MBQ4835968.1 S8 family serine peptidase [Pseudoalteromonas luteoviolacea]MDK2594319.1 S8 family serine peptidase [Pseudoalteromonas sp. P94(2023)]
MGLFNRSAVFASVLVSLGLCAGTHASNNDSAYLVQYKHGQLSQNVLGSLKVIGQSGEKIIAQGVLSHQQVSEIIHIDGVSIEADYGLSLSSNSLDYYKATSNSLDVLAYSELEPYWLRATSISKLPSASNDISVCVIDSGVDSSHPDLPANIHGYHSVYAGFWDQDALSHGTHMAGIIAAQNNGIGVKGALSEGGASLQVHKLIKTANGRNSAIWGGNLIEAIEVCANSGAKVINMSLSGEQFSPMTMSVIDRLAYDRGLIFVAAAGNHGSREKKLQGQYNDALHYPASYHNVLSIGALETDGNIAAFSPTNPNIDFVAPGSKILSTANRSHYAVQDVVIQHSGGISDALKYTQIDVGLSSYSMQTSLPQQCVYTLTAEDVQQQMTERTLSYQTRQNLSSAQSSCVAEGGKVLLINYPQHPNGRLRGIDYYTEFPTLLVHQWPVVTDSANMSVAIRSYHSDYVVGAGTSQATAIISGGIARLWSQNPNWDRAQIINALRSTSHDLGAAGKDSVYGHGLPNFAEALAYLQSGKTPACPMQWYHNKSYEGGEQVTYQGKIYSAHYWNKGASPILAPNMWHEQGECDTNNQSQSTPDDGGYSILDFSGLEDENSAYSCKGLSLMCGG